MKAKALTGLIAVSLLLSACTANEHRKAVQDNDTDRVTVGTAQREVRIGMTAADVAQVLGSPNIVSTDEQRRETWIYDKIATEVTYSRSGTAVAGLLFGGSGGVLPAGSQSAGATSTSQRTLTVIIRFDENSRVRDFSYHTSRF